MGKKDYFCQIKMQININIAEQHQEPPVIMEMMRQMQVQQNKTCEEMAEST